MVRGNITVVTDEERFRVLFERHHGELLRFAARRVLLDEAGDIVAETFLIAWRKLEVVPASSERAWLFATARNVIGSVYRRRSRETALLPAEDVADHAESVADRLLVQAALTRLSSLDQEALRLAEWDGLDDAEAAAVLGCSRTAFRVRLHRARRRFAAALETPQEVVR